MSEKSCDILSILLFFLLCYALFVDRKKKGVRTRPGRKTIMYFTDKKIEELRKQIENLAANGKRCNTDKKDPTQKAEEKVGREVKSRYAMDVGYRLKELREKRGVTQQDMTEIFYPIAPMSLSGVSRIESGEREPRLALLVMIAEQWDVDLHWLLTGENRNRPLLPAEVQAAMSTIADYCQNSNSV